MATPDYPDEVLGFIDHLRERFPDFDRRWHSDQLGGGERLAYVEAGTLAMYLADLMEFDPESDALRSLSQEIEKAFASELDKDWLVVGLLESIQNMVANDHIDGSRSITPGDVKRHLGPLAQAGWATLDESWGNSVDDM